ncbi:MAG: GNAT family N-acetyltransferase [Bacteroidetes bacterium]|nr:MAG: GNAT family N-acetyltransferase [Bacteroidota bacterium]
MPRATIRVLIADEKDAGLIAEMSRQTFYDSFASQNTAANMAKFMNEVFTRANLMEEVEQPGNIFLLAYLDGNPCGYARLRIEEKIPAFGGSSVIEIARIYAVKDVIGKGVGSALMEKCLVIAREKKARTIWLGVWEKNERAIDFYSKWGFKIFGSHIFMLGDDAQTDLLMKKEL